MKVKITESWPGEFDQDSETLGRLTGCAVDAVFEAAGVDAGGVIYKAQSSPRGGELDVVEQLTAKMKRMYDDRLNRLLNDIEAEARAQTKA
jgi:hypothetical protein